MKEIKAFVHQHRAADVIEAIKATQARTAPIGRIAQKGRCSPKCGLASKAQV